MKTEPELISNDQGEVTPESGKEGSKSLFGSVTRDDVAVRMIQTGRVASLHTIFSHYGRTEDNDGRPLFPCNH